jgi:hypothetical protein
MLLICLLTGQWVSSNQDTVLDRSIEPPSFPSALVHDTFVHDCRNAVTLSIAKFLPNRYTGTDEALLGKNLLSAYPLAHLAREV